MQHYFFNFFLSCHITFTSTLKFLLYLRPHWKNILHPPLTIAQREKDWEERMMVIIPLEDQQKYWCSSSLKSQQCVSQIEMVLYQRIRISSNDNRLCLSNTSYHNTSYQVLREMLFRPLLKFKGMGDVCTLIPYILQWHLSRGSPRRCRPNLVKPLIPSWMLSQWLNNCVCLSQRLGSTYHDPKPLT